MDVSLGTCECCPYEVSQNKNGYYIEIIGELDLKKSVQIIDYFGFSGWRSFICNNPKGAQNSAGKVFSDILKKAVGGSDLSFFDNKYTKVFILDHLEIKYFSDSLALYVDKKNISININFKYSSVAPVKLKDYYIISTDDSIYVYQSIELINKHFRPSKVSRYERIEAYNSWANYYDSGEIKLSYSYEKNKFYEIKSKY